MNYQFQPHEVVKVREVIETWGPKAAFVYYHQLLKNTVVPVDDIEDFLHQVHHYEDTAHA